MELLPSREPYEPTAEEVNSIHLAGEAGAEAARDASMKMIRHTPRAGHKGQGSYVVLLLQDNPYLHPRRESVAWKDGAQRVIDQRLAT